MNASLKITINVAPMITTTALPNGTAGSAYKQSLAVSGGTPPFKWSIVGGGLPSGLSFDTSAASINGTPSGGGTWYFLPQVTDAAGGVVKGISVNGIGGYPLSLAIMSTIPAGNPIPYIAQPLIPAAISPGGTGFTLTVNGTGFVPGATVDFDGASLPTTFVSNVQLTATVAGSDIAAAGTAFITVVNPVPGGGRSNVVYLPVALPEAMVSFSAFGPIPLTGILAVADFNADGKADLAVVDYNAGSVTIELGNGSAAFAQAPGSPIPLPASPFNSSPLGPGGLVLVGDFNNSGKPGLAVLEPANDIAAILFGDGNGGLTPSTATAYAQGCPGAMTAADFTAQGNLDLAFLNSCGANLAFLLGYGDGAFTYLSAPQPPNVAPPNSAAVGDFNGDGKLDLAYTAYDGDTRVSILLGNGDGTFVQASGSPIAVASSIPASVVAGDFNGDGKLDLAVSTAPSLNGNSIPGSVYIFLGNGDGSFILAPGSPITVGINPLSMVVGDFNGDGKLDLAVANYFSNSVSLLLGNGDGTFAETAGSPFPVGRAPISLVVGDFNGSGRLGLAVSNSSDQTISILAQK